MIGDTTSLHSHLLNILLMRLLHITRPYRFAVSETNSFNHDKDFAGHGRSPDNFVMHVIQLAGISQ